MTQDIIHKLHRIQNRRRVAEFCRRCGKTRAWFYKVLRGKTTLLPYLGHIDAVLASSAHPITAAREALGLSQSSCAAALGISRQTLYQWEHQPAIADRIARVKSLQKVARRP